MPTPYEAKFVKCPFYHTNNANKIVCEGICDGNTINLVFESQTNRKDYMHRKCNTVDGCRACYLYKLLDNLYE